MIKFRLIFTVLLCIALLFSAVSCGKTDEEMIIGTWETEFDIAELINEAMEDELGEYADYFKITSLNVTVNTTFYADNTYYMVVNEEQFKTAFESIGPVFTEGVRNMCEDAAESIGVSVEEILTGMTVEEVADEMTSSMDVGSMASLLKAAGKYRIEDGKLWKSDMLDTDIDESKYEIYEFVDENTLDFISYVGDDADSNPFEYPMKYKKIG